MGKSSPKFNITLIKAVFFVLAVLSPDLSHLRKKELVPILASWLAGSELQCGYKKSGKQAAEGLKKLIWENAILTLVRGTMKGRVAELKGKN